MTNAITSTPVLRRAASLAAVVAALASAACGDLDPATDCASYAATGNCSGVPQVAVRSGPVDALAAYDGQTGCDSTPRPGVVAFRDLVLAAYPCTSDSGIARSCSTGGTSEHKEGRAWDWGTTPAIAGSFDLLDWLLAPDDQGNPYALARRFGIMYMIFDGKVWKAYQADRGWQPYTGSNDHTDHVHFSFSWQGANKQTTFWTAPTQPAPQPVPQPEPQPVPQPAPGPQPAGPQPADQPPATGPAPPAPPAADDWGADPGAPTVLPPAIALPHERYLLGGDGCAMSPRGSQAGAFPALALLLLACGARRRRRAAAQRARWNT